jgi:hypothetical protein
MHEKQPTSKRGDVDQYSLRANELFLVIFLKSIIIDSKNRDSGLFKISAHLIQTIATIEI